MSRIYEWRDAGRVPRGAVFILLILAVFLPSQSRSDIAVQPPGETQVIQEFKAAAPDLFRAWLVRWDDRLKAQNVKGRPLPWKESLNGRLNGLAHFTECTQETPPSSYDIDIRKTDSILSPFIGTLTVPVALNCTSRKAVIPGTYPSKGKVADLEAACFDHTYEECIASGAARPVPKGGVWSAFADTADAYKGKVVLTYRWSEGKWEFNEDKADPPLPLIETKDQTKTASLATHGDTITN